MFFGHELAEDQREQGDDGDDDAESNAFGVGREVRKAGDHSRERLRDRRAAVRARQDPDERDAAHCTVERNCAGSFASSSAAFAR